MSNDNDSDNSASDKAAPMPATREEILKRLQTICAVDMMHTMNLTTLKVIPPSMKLDILLLRQIAANQVTQFRVLQEVLQELIEIGAALKPFDDMDESGGRA